MEELALLIVVFYYVVIIVYKNDRKKPNKDMTAKGKTPNQEHFQPGIDIGAVVFESLKIVGRCSTLYSPCWLFIIFI